VPFAKLSSTLDEIVASRATHHLTGYQNAALAERYKALVEKVRVAEQPTGKFGPSPKPWRALTPSCSPTRTNTRCGAGFIAEAAFQAELDRQFEGDYRLEIPPGACRCSPVATPRPAI